MKQGANNDDVRYLKVITGLSGSGKSVAMRALEDLGYYCVDNLPIVLLKPFISSVLEPEFVFCRRTAVGIDSRNRKFFDSLDDNIQYLQRSGVQFEIIYLDAEISSLIKRFGETRRTHPLMEGTMSLLECIETEKRLLAPLSDMASKHFDTTSISPHELRNLIQEDAAGFGVSDSSLLFKSFAYKHGTPLDADFVFDVRCLPNPYWIDELKKFNGLEGPIKEYFSTKPDVQNMIEQIDCFIAEWLSKFHDAGRVYLTIAIGCTGGRHRSVYVVEQIAQRFVDRGHDVFKRHNELPSP
ncbi:MAG: RNase adapter RapZ [Acidiferrobacterales bacterium]|nr:RNase adapter RapZ [Acidiferrobacterales bacterium]